VLPCNDILTTYYTMSLDEWLDGSNETVDPEVRAYVGSLVNAVRLSYINRLPDSGLHD
jgi:hypothetical protein